GQLCHRDRRRHPRCHTDPASAPDSSESPACRPRSEGGRAICGVTGWLDFRRDLRLHRQTAVAMSTMLACRGPDAEGLWIDQHVALGHRRLAVIDPAGGSQPMLAEHGHRAAVINYCGEIYNFRSLRAALVAAGHRFRTRSDTEVLLRGY